MSTIDLMRRSIAWMSLLGLAIGCPAPNIYGSNSSHGSSTTGAHTVSAASGATSGTGSTSGTGTTGGAVASGGSTSSAGSTGTTGGPVCSGRPPLTACSPSQVEIETEAYSVCLSLNATAPLADVQVVNLDDMSQTANTDTCGDLDFCLTPGSSLTLGFSASGYPNTLLGTIQAQSSFNEPPIYVICTTFASYFAGQVQATLPTSMGGAGVMVFVLPLLSDDVSITPDYPDAGCYDRSGWTFTLVAPDGGVIVPEIAPFYPNGDGSPNGDVTSGHGLAAFFNVDAAWGAVTVQATRPGNDLPDGGQRCVYASNQLQFTGKVPLLNGYLSYFPYAVLPTTFPTIGQPCTQPSDCLGPPYLYCVGDAGGCCGLPGLVCTSDSDCCSAAGSPESCGTAGVCCIPPGATCLSQTDCCAGTCVGQNTAANQPGTCSAP